MAVLKKFMCCGQLQTGGITIGWIGLIIQIIILASVSAVLANVDSIASIKELNTVLRISLPIYLACTVISIIAHILLILGTNWKHRLMLLPWMIITMIIIWAIFVSCLVIGILLFSATDGDVIAVTVIILGLLVTGILIYLWICILSLFQDMRKEEGEVDNTNTYNSATNSFTYTQLQQQL